MRNPVVRVLKNSLIKGAAGKNAAGAMVRGAEVAGQLSSSTAEFLRVRRDPAEVAVRRRRAAIRRSNIWGGGTVVGLAGGAALTFGLVGSGITASSLFSLLLVAALTIWCIAGLTRAIRDRRRWGREIDSLPPPQPARTAVSSPIKFEIAKLDAYSDNLRQLAILFPVEAHQGLRTEVLTAADEAERDLRRQGREFSALHRSRRAAPSTATAELGLALDDLSGRISAGVADYGQLVAAASETVAASTALSAASAGLQDPTERLQALAMGMREIAGRSS